MLSIALVFALNATAAEPLPTPAVVSGSVVRIDGLSSEHAPERPLFVWLPDGYPEAGPYALLLVHDGQMLFDASTTWNGKAWEIDEVARALIEAGETRPFVVVAVPNAGPERHAEYLPQAPLAGLTPAQRRRALALEREPGVRLFAAEPRADRYLRYLVDDVLPTIRERFAVSEQREDTVLMGSSMGGLISLYALVEHPDVFGGAACISTHWPGLVGDENPFPAALRAYLAEALPEPGRHRLYFDHGTAGLDALYPPLQAKIDALLRQRGFRSEHWMTSAFPGAEHDEDAWRDRLAQPLTFLLGNHQGSARSVR